MIPTLRRFRFVLVLVATLAALPWNEALASSTRAELDDRARLAGQAFRELRETPDRKIPADLIARSRCVAVVPNVIKVAWVFGGRYGKGLLSCRGKTGEWSPPVMVLMTGGSFGLQFGASSTDVVLFFMTTGSVRSLLSNRVKLSGEAGVAAGPVGRETEAATDARFRAEIYSYARSRGLFAGVSLAGGYLGVNLEDTAAYYGQRYTATQVLFDYKVTSVPKSAWSFLGALPRPRAAASPAPKGRAATAAPTPVPAPSAPAPRLSPNGTPAPEAPAPRPIPDSTTLTPAAPPARPAAPKAAAAKPKPSPPKPSAAPAKPSAMTKAKGTAPRAAEPAPKAPEPAPKAAEPAPPVAEEPLMGPPAPEPAPQPAPAN